MLTLEECIEYFETEAETSDSLMMPYEPRKKYSDDCKQMADWLRELKYIKTMTSVYEKIRKGNMKDGVIDAIDDHDILFNYFKQIKEVFEEVNADADSN